MMTADRAARRAAWQEMVEAMGHTLYAAYRQAMDGRPAYPSAVTAGFLTVLIKVLREDIRGEAGPEWYVKMVATCIDTFSNLPDVDYDLVRAELAKMEAGKGGRLKPPMSINE